MLKKGGDAVDGSLQGELSERAGKGRVFRTRKIAEKKPGLRT
jgi:hypothetical protein